MVQDGNTNYILTYQSENSIDPLESYVSDDFFGLLEDNPGEVNGLLQIGVGRLPLDAPDGDISQAVQVMQKMLGFYRSGMQ